MRDYDEVTHTVLKRRDEQIARHKKRLHAFRRSTAAVLSFCLVAVAGVSIWKNGALNSSVTGKFSKDTLIENVTAEAQDTTAFTGNTGKENTSPVQNDLSPEDITTAIPTETTASVQTTLPVTEKAAGYVQPVVTEPAGVSAQLPPTTTHTDNSGTAYVPNDERSITMKKIATCLSALMAASSITIPNANAEYQLDSSRYSSYAPYIKKLASGELDPDINMDGTFDLTDCRILSWYVEREWHDTILDISPETEANIVKAGDYYQDGEIDGADVTTLIYHYILTHDVKMEYCMPTYYDPDFSPVTEHGTVQNQTAEYCFALEFFSDMNYILAGYPAIEKMADNGELDFDANADGKVDIADYADFSVFVSEVMDGNVFLKSERSILPADEWQRVCDELHKIPWIDFNGSQNYWYIAEYMYAYFAAHIDLKPEYFENDHYENIISGSAGMQLGEKLRSGAVSMGIVPDDYANEFCKFDDSIFKEEFYAYYTNVKNGSASIPDINMDGVVDRKDYSASDTYFADIICGRTAAESALPADVWNNIANNCDFNGNGKSGDIYDIMTVQIYVIMEADEEASPEVISVSGMNYEQGFKMLSSMDIERSGDANNDKSVNIADAVFIMQSIADPDSYSLTPKGSFNADIANTGDGVTFRDALAIQRMLMNIEQ